ncbi:MAG: M48 family metalloprotease [Desulforhopalus sp.]
MTGAAVDAVSAITLTDEEVKSLAQRAVKLSDNNHQVAPEQSPYNKRLQRLVQGSLPQDGNTFNFKVYLTDNVNAFAMADGSIRVNSGLMDLMDDEELLFVIGHEMGHVLKEHSRKKVVLAYGSSALRKGLASQDNRVGQIARSVVGAYAEQLANAQFSQHEERQADAHGVAFLRAAGYTEASAVSALNKLAGLAAQHTFLSSHPEPDARARALLSGREKEVDKQDSVIDSFVEFTKTIVLGLVALADYLVKWLLSLFAAAAY